MKKKILSTILAGLFAFSSFSISDAATRNEIAAIKVSKSDKFHYCTKDSITKQKLIEYVRDITNKHSKNFILLRIESQFLMSMVL